jgi:hypothetical protein
MIDDTYAHKRCFPVFMRTKDAFLENFLALIETLLFSLVMLLFLIFLGVLT